MSSFRLGLFTILTLVTALAFGAAPVIPRPVAHKPANPDWIREVVQTVEEQLQQMPGEPLKPRIRCELGITIDGAGNVLSVGIARSTGQPAIDKRFMAAVLAASPLPAPVDRGAGFPITFGLAVATRPKWKEMVQEGEPWAGNAQQKEGPVQQQAVDQAPIRQLSAEPQAPAAEAEAPLPWLP